MTSHSLITDAENAIATGRLHAAVSRTDPDHEAAVELMARGLLVDRKRAEADVRNQVSLDIVASIDAHEAADPHAYFQFRAGMREALRIVLGETAPASEPRQRQSVWDPAHCSLCDVTGEHLVRGADGRWRCPDGCSVAAVDGSPGDLFDPAEHRGRREQFPGERNARRMLSGGDV